MSSCTAPRVGRTEYGGGAKPEAGGMDGSVSLIGNSGPKLITDLCFCANRGAGAKRKGRGALGDFGLGVGAIAAPDGLSPHFARSPAPGAADSRAHAGARRRTTVHLWPSALFLSTRASMKRLVAAHSTWPTA